jgi:hypothetical protein
MPFSADGPICQASQFLEIFTGAFAEAKEQDVDRRLCSSCCREGCRASKSGIEQPVQGWRVKHRRGVKTRLGLVAVNQCRSEWMTTAAFNGDHPPWTATIAGTVGLLGQEAASVAPRGVTQCSPEEIGTFDFLGQQSS